LVDRALNLAALRDALADVDLHALGHALRLAHRDLDAASHALMALDHLGLAAVLVLGAVDPHLLGARRRAAVAARIARVARLPTLVEERLDLAALPVAQTDQLAVVHRDRLAHLDLVIDRARLDARNHDRLGDRAGLDRGHLHVFGDGAGLDRRNADVLRHV